MYTSYVLIGIAVVGILFFAVAKIVGSPENAKTALIGIGGLVVLLGISYALSSSEHLAKAEISESTSHNVGTGIVALYILGAATIVTILYSEISRLIK